MGNSKYIYIHTDLYITCTYISYKEGRDQSSKESSQYASKQAMKQTSNQANHQAVSFSNPSLQSTDMFLISIIRDVPPLSLDEPPNCMKIISSFHANTTKQKTNHLTILPTKKHRISTQKFRTKHGNFRVSFSSQPIGPDKLRLFRISWRSFTWPLGPCWHGKVGQKITQRLETCWKLDLCIKKRAFQAEKSHLKWMKMVDDI